MRVRVRVRVRVHECVYMYEWSLCMCARHRMHGHHCVYVCLCGVDTHVCFYQTEQDKVNLNNLVPPHLLSTMPPPRLNLTTHTPPPPPQSDHSVSGHIYLTELCHLVAHREGETDHCQDHHLTHIYLHHTHFLPPSLWDSTGPSNLTIKYSKHSPGSVWSPGTPWFC